ncbi:MAG TPA: copper homeostasis periplasmic binding protein CopC [Acidimicrobiia bacterium]|nr:copper homeostasis periplasmic binding protein CopC [Acidimicrobiia bacterium]
MADLRALAVALLVSVMLAPEAFAHAFLDSATPAVGSAVHGAPVQVELHFSEGLEPAFSTVRVDDAKGKRVDAGDVHVDPGDASILEVSLGKLAPGRYHVTWRVVSIDTHVTEGAFTFDVLP